MILDSGIASVFHMINIAKPGAKPSLSPVKFHESWYGELSFETAPAAPTDSREDTRVDARIRILQNREIRNQDQVNLYPYDEEPRRYRVKRAYHGFDKESGELITDLSLEVIKP